MRLTIPTVSDFTAHGYLSQDITTKYVILISIESRLDTEMTDVPCDVLLSDCEHQQYLDQAVAMILSRGQLTEYLYASKSLALILFASQLLNDYTLTNRIGPYEWWAYTILLLTLSGLFEFLSFLAYKIWPSPTQFSLFFNTTAITASFPALIDWLLIYEIN